MTVIAPYSSRAGADTTALRRKIWFSRSRSHDGYTIIRCPAWRSQKSTLLSRFLENVTFGLTAAAAALSIRRPVSVYVNTWPIFAAGLALCAAKLRRASVIISVQDLYPESLATQGRFHEKGVLFRLLRAMDSAISRAACAVVVISEAFRDAYRLRPGTDARNVHVVPNWADAESVIPDDPGGKEIRKAEKIPDRGLLFVYGGNIGAASGIEAIVDAFRDADESFEGYLLVAGEGSRVVAVRAATSETSVGRVRIRSPWPSAETSQVLAAADILLLATQGRQAFASMPSKLITYMLADRPVVAVAQKDSELARTITEAGCGWVVDPSDPRALSDVLGEIGQSPPEDRKAMGHAGRAFALAHFTRDICLPSIVALVEGAMERKT